MGRGPVKRGDVELHGDEECHTESMLSTSDNATGIKLRKSTLSGSTDARGGGVVGRSSPNDSRRERAKGSSSSDKSLRSVGESSGEES